MRLTKTQTEILTMIAQGLKTKAIANRLEISDYTVRNHRSDIYERLGVKNSSEAVAKALVEGYIKEDEIWRTS